ncbi:glycine betaine/choline ABC-type transport system substrate-binding protein [Sinobacterium caligoides]|uniref:Glycine betaine/choline ABC-type transport system substrate-binding protein n=1 Tax=Sinobacterium caligoides TaxID=933926 RepID=A0A3N2DME8_9GAMM|nr:glycine betaine ABC transporter substrate-binding protein [Sinobacterium caligoides]ROS00960.1 glycine betaine/choline ABC-type transport system substrate-binding protein [Sinobacterium caligoides]
MFRQLYLYPLLLALTLLSQNSLAGTTLRIGYHNYDEQRLMGAISKEQFRSEGIKVRLVPFQTYHDLRDAMFADEIDMYWGYTGQTAINDLYMPPPYDQNQVYQAVKEFDSHSGFTWLIPSQLDNHFTLLVRNTNNKTNDITTISDLAKKANKKRLDINVSYTFLEKRIDSLEYLADFYGSNINRFNSKAFDNVDEIYTQLRDSVTDIGLGYNSSFQLDFYSLRALRDDKGFFPPYQMAPVIKADFLKAHPEVEVPLDDISQRMNTHLMRYLLQRWKVDQIGLRSTAKEFVYADDIYPNAGRGTASSRQ